MKAHKSENGHKTLSSPRRASMNGAMTGAIEKSATALGQNMRSLQDEGVRFVTRRVEDNLRAAEQFGKSKSLPELFAAQQKWFADMTRAYSEEWAKCGELLSEAMQASAQVSSNGRGATQPDETP